ncbi:MAG: choice-of-anchor D domain-containing protein [Chlorobi bacterium]|nr:MAG: Coagulation factor protein [Chlorobi bacterium OLB7]MBK8910592.1 choice-of-anchor D domain-containing protein [Chlorobiota bacterium]
MRLSRRLCTLLALLVAVAAALPAQNLIVNPGAELPMIADSIPGWIQPLARTWTEASTIPAFAGTNYFFAGNTPLSELSQDIDVTTLAAGIDAGTTRFVFDGRVQSLPEAVPDSAQIVVQCRDAANTTVLSAFNPGAVASTAGWQQVSGLFTPPSGTRFLRVRLIAIRSTGVSNDAFFDELFLSAIAPSGGLSVINRLTNFDTTLCGTKKCSTLIFRNVGQTPLTIQSADAFFGTFEIDAGVTFNFPQTLQPNEQLSFNVCYNPTVPGRADTFKGLVRYDAASVDSFMFVGRATGPSLSASRTNVSFGTVQIFNTRCETITLRNDGDGPLSPGAITGVNLPFFIQTPPPAVIPPGGTADVVICFTPDAEGNRNATANFSYVSCGATQNVTVQLSGVGALPPKLTLGPVLQITPDPLDYDTTLCGTQKCRNLTFQNIGNAPLTITQMDQILAPFAVAATTPLNLPLTLQPNQSQVVQVCYSPTFAPRIDSQRIAYIADNRVSLSIMMVFDTSGSMTIATGTGVSRITAANAGGRVFLDNLVNDPARGVVDEAGIVNFSSGVLVAQDFTTNGALLQARVPNAANGGTRLYDAVDTALNRVLQRNLPGRRVIVILSDGDDEGGFLQNRIDAIVARSQNNVRIFTIGLGSGLTANGINTLQQMANRTGGSSFFTNNPDTLVQIYLTIAQQLSRSIPGTYLIRGRAVAPLLTINPITIDFDSVRIGRSVCRQITLTNNGDAPLQFAGFPAAVGGFSIQAQTPFPAIPPGGSSTISACFAPTRLRVQSASLPMPYNSCRTPDTLQFRGVGYDSVVIAIRDSVVARPGSTFEYPIFLMDSIPDHYDVRDLTFTLGYNKTLLFPLDPPVRSDAAVAVPLANAAISSVYLPNESGALTTYTMTGATPISNATPNSLLTRLRFRALLGNAISTPLTITAARMADGNPKVGIINPGTFRIDSMCYLEDRLLDARRRISGALKMAVMNNAEIAALDFTLPAAAPTQAIIFDRLGREVTRSGQQAMNAGNGQMVIDISALRSGIYFVQLRSGEAVDGGEIVVSR